MCRGLLFPLFVYITQIMWIYTLAVSFVLSDYIYNSRYVYRACFSECVGMGVGRWGVGSCACLCACVWTCQ